jgi:3-phosphoglycerate kinase
MQRADKFLIGGAMAYTFLKSKGEDVGASRVEADKLDLARDILEKAESKKIKIILPVDHLVVDNLENPRVKNIVNNIPEGFLGVDIGPKTVELFIKELSDAKTVLWNGPVGIFEKADYAIGTKALAECLANLKQAMVIVGGGDSASAAKKFQVADKLSHVSTGGGASLEFLEGKALPGIAIIPDKK